MPRKSALVSNGVTRLSTTMLQQELRRRDALVGALHRRRERLLKRLAALDRQIQLAGGAGGHNGIRHRPRNSMTLPEALAKVLDGRTMSVTEAAAAVQKAGYKTSSNNFRTQVNIALINGPFKRVGRGQYTAK